MAVLILRPEAKIQHTCSAFEQANIDAVGIGLIKTQAKHDIIASFIDRLHAQYKPAIAIFISTTAVQVLFSKLQVWPAQVQAIAVGSGTAELLANEGVTAIVPKQQTTEGLLALAELQHLSGQEIFLLKGDNGRELLADTLKKRGAVLTIADLYHRIIVNQPVATRNWGQSEIHCVLATSGEIIQAAFNYFEPEWLKRLTWIVVSRRLVEFATKLGIENILQSDGAGIDKLIQATKLVGVMNDGQR